MIDRQTYNALLPDGTTAALIDGTITLDNNWSPYVQATDVTIVTPASLAPFDPRKNNATSPPRVLIGAFQEFNDSEPLSTFTAAYAHCSDLTAAFGHCSDITAAMVHDLWGNASVPPAVYRTFDLAIFAITPASDGTSKLTLYSDEYALTEWMSPNQIAGWAAPVDTLHNLIKGLDKAQWAPYVPDFAASTFDYSLASQINATPNPNYPPVTSVWSFLDTYVQLAGGRFWVDEKRQRHLEPSPTSSPGAFVFDVTEEAVRWSDEIGRLTTWYNVVLVVYSWTDAAGLQQTYIDQGFAPGAITGANFRTLVVQRSQPAPGPGAAQAIANRVCTYGDDLTIDAVNDFSVTPGQPATVTTPNGVVHGVVGAVSWHVAAAEMSVTPRQLI